MIKIFCLGLSKTGTTSLSKALQILGYKVDHFPFRIMRYEKPELKYSSWAAEHNDVLADIPTVRFYKRLDREYPDAKFIYLERDMDKWLDSCKRHFWPGQIIKSANWLNQLHQDIYGCIDYNQEKYRQAYNNHDKEVREYFKDRPNDLLVMNITKGEGWEKICPFLNIPIPDKTFPKQDCIYTNIFKIINLQQYRKAGEFDN